MQRYILRRLAQTVVVLLGVSLATFALMFAAGDPTAVIKGENWTAAELAVFRHELGFDRPWPVQYLDYLGKAVRGDLGVSLRQGRPVFDLIVERLPATLELTMAAMLISLVFSIPIGILSATRRNSVYDVLGMLGALLGQSMPSFWLGIVLILIFGVYLRWLPISGRGGLERLILPAITLSTYSLARNTRLVRSSMLEVLGQEYITTARAKGLRETVLLYRHALKNALIPVVTVVGLDIGTLLGGALITETIFAWPGVGRLTVQAIFAKDLPLVQAAVTILAGSFVFINLLVDLFYSVLDPRIRYS